jgi:hypothetical protein
VTSPIAHCGAIGTGMSRVTHLADVIGLVISLQRLSSSAPRERNPRTLVREYGTVRRSGGFELSRAARA